MTASGPIAIGIDIGGSGIKAGAVDTDSGAPVSERLRIRTPSPSTPDEVIAEIVRIVARLEPLGGVDGFPVGVAFPGVVLGGRTMTAANVDQAWADFPAVEHLERAIGRPVALVNDADAAGFAEMKFGAGVGHGGVVLMLTLGSGVGSGLFVDGRLVPNTELGHLEIRGKDAELRSSAAARIRRGQSWKEWARELNEHLHLIERVLWPDLIILGGGVSKRWERFVPFLTCRAPIVPAALFNEAGIVGTALFALDHLGGPVLTVEVPEAPTA